MKGMNSHSRNKFDKVYSDFDYSVRERSRFYIDSVSAYQAMIRGVDKYSIYNTQSQSQKQLDETWVLDIETNVINKRKKTAGIIDNLFSQVIVDNRFILLFALFEPLDYSVIKDKETNIIDYRFAGYGMFHQPKSVVTAFSSLTKGSKSVCTMSIDGSYMSAFQFTTGARVIIANREDSEDDWNTGTITSINSYNRMEIELDNNPFGYGHDLTGAPQYDIVQLDQFRPYDISVANRNLYDEYQLLSGSIRISNSGQLENMVNNFGYVVMERDFIYSGSITTGVYESMLYEYIPPTAVKAYMYINVIDTANTDIEIKCIYTGITISQIYKGQSSNPEIITRIPVALYQANKSGQIYYRVTGWKEDLL